jgi:catechol 2,3-dioxygenase-like lactoylglutathione lyase family enzyme
MNAEHIGIYAQDTSRLSQWYIDNLGFKIVRTLEKEGRPPIFFLQAEEGLAIEILPTNSPRSARQLTDPGYSHIGLVVDDFDQVVSTLQTKGIAVQDIRSTTNGWTIGYFDDPEGNRLEMVYRPK